MTAAFTFELGCPVCAGDLYLVSTDQLEDRRSTAVLRCEPCDIFVCVSATMRVAKSVPRRFKVEPLIDWIVARNDTRSTMTGADAHVAYVVNRLDIDRAQVYYWRRYGLDDATADRLATRLNVHPTQIWPDYCEQVPA